MSALAVPAANVRRLATFGTITRAALLAGTATASSRRCWSSQVRDKPLQITDPAIPLGSTILVSGANGFIASHVVDQLLAAGYLVRGSVRNLEKSSWLLDLMNTKYGVGQLELVKVEDMTREGALKEAVRGVAGVAHLASIMSWDPDPNKVIPPVIASNLSIIQAAAEEPSVKRFVFTSSSHAAIERKPNIEFEVTENSWNESVIKAAWKQSMDDPKQGFYVYGASKAQGEQAVWKWFRENQPNFELNVVIPNLTLGRVLSIEHQVDTMALQFIRWLWEGNVQKFYELIPPQHFVDVQDCARIHVAALLHREVSNERLFAFAKPFTCNDILAVLRSRFPNREFPEDIPNHPRDLSRVPKEKAERLLRDMGRDGWTTLDECIGWIGRSFEEAERTKSGVARA